VIIDGTKFYGSPWQPWFYDWAFNLQRCPEIRSKWELIPEGIDILITHGPPYGIEDLTARGDKAGCHDLLEVVEKIKPRVHIFGHIHEGYGINAIDGTTFINANSYNHNYRRLNPPVVYEFEK
jgi:Icc-related predicted phosphoesterase